MFYKSIHGYTILNFDKTNYNKVVQSLIESNCYISYIDRSRDQSHTNKKYERYIDLKQALYTSSPLHYSSDSIAYSYSLPEHIRESELKELQEKYAVKDDYSVETTIEQLDNNIYLKKHRLYTLEEDIRDLSLLVDKYYEEINDMCLNSNFINNQQRRFMLIPFTTKYNDQYLKPTIIATVYGVGIITIQVIIPIPFEKAIKVSEDPPRYFELDEVEFTEYKKKYTTSDYWEKYLAEKVSIDMILSYYELFISNVVTTEINLNPNHRPVSWGFGDFSLLKNTEDHRKFIDSNKRIYVQHLKNSNKEITERLSTSEVDESLEKTKITNNLEITYLCNPTTSVISIGHKTSHKKAVEALAGEEAELKKEQLYESILRDIFFEQYLIAILQYIRFYELTFIKRYFLKILLNDIVSDEKSSVAKYNGLIREMNQIQLNYDEDVLFFTEGSPKDLYLAILEKSGVNQLEEKTKDLIKNIKEDANNIKMSRVQKNETYILIISSLLTILLGYNGIKIIITDILPKFPCLNVISNHPLKTTFIIWLILVINMVYLNFKRWHLNK